MGRKEKGKQIKVRIWMLLVVNLQVGLGVLSVSTDLQTTEISCPVEKWHLWKVDFILF